LLLSFLLNNCFHNFLLLYRASPPNHHRKCNIMIIYK
jgi:hypothetical protein